MEFGVEMMMGKARASQIDLILAKDGSGVGAAIIAAIAAV
jgi:hexokinase